MYIYVCSSLNRYQRPGCIHSVWFWVFDAPICAPPRCWVIFERSSERPFFWLIYGLYKYSIVHDLIWFDSQYRSKSIFDSIKLIQSSQSCTRSCTVKYHVVCTCYLYVLFVRVVCTCVLYVFYIYSPPCNRLHRKHVFTFTLLLQRLVSSNTQWQFR